MISYILLLMVGLRLDMGNWYWFILGFGVLCKMISFGIEFGKKIGGENGKN